MDLNQLVALALPVLQGPIGMFLLFVIVDNVIGIGGALKVGKFQWGKLLSFVESQFATQSAIAIAVTSLSVLLTNGSDLAYLALLAACIKASASVVTDINNKLQGLVAKPALSS